MRRGLRNQILISWNCVRFCADAESGIITADVCCTHHQDVRVLDEWRQYQRSLYLRRTNNGSYMGRKVTIGFRRGENTRKVKFWRDITVTITTICKVAMRTINKRPISQIMILQERRAQYLRRNNNVRDKTSGFITVIRRGRKNEG